MAQVITPVGVEQVPANHRAKTASNFIGSMGIFKDQVYTEFIEKYGMGRISDFVHARMRYVPVSGDTFKHYEGGRLHESFVAAVKTSAVPASGGAAHSFTVDSTYIPTQTVTAMNVPYVRVGDILENTYGSQLLVTIASGADFTAVPYAASWGSMAGVTTGTNITFNVIGREVGKRSVEPANGLNPLPWEWNGTLAIRNDKADFDGDALNQEIWFKVTNQATGEEGFQWNIKTYGDTIIRFKNNQELAEVFGRPNANTSNNSSVTGVSGLKYSIETYGHTQDLNGVAPTLQSFRRLNRKWDAYGGAREMMVCAGNIFLENVDDMIAGTSSMSSGNNFGSFTNEEEFVKFGFKGFQVGKYKYAMMSYDPFNKPEHFGADGYNEKYQRSAFVIPFESTVDPKDGTTHPFGVIRYSAGTYDRRFETFPLGGANGVYTESTDRWSIHMRSHTGPEWFGLNRFAFIQG